MINIIAKNHQKPPKTVWKSKTFRREIRNVGDGENRTIWHGGDGLIPIPFLMNKPEERENTGEISKYSKMGGKIYKNHNTKKF